MLSLLRLLFKVMIFAEISLNWTAAQLGHRSAVLCSFHIPRDNSSLIQHGNKPSNQINICNSEECTRNMSPGSWLLISVDETAMQLSRRHSGKLKHDGT